MFGSTRLDRRLKELEAKVDGLRASISNIDSTIDTYASTMELVLDKRTRDAKRNLDDTMYRLELLEKRLRPTAEDIRSSRLAGVERPRNRITKTDCTHISNEQPIGNPVPPNRTYDELPKENDQPAEEGLGARVNAKARRAATKWDQAIADLKSETARQFEDGPGRTEGEVR